MKKLNADELLHYIVALLLQYLSDLADTSDLPSQQFAYGEKTAYTECLEILSLWEYAAEAGIDFDIEQRFPL